MEKIRTKIVKWLNKKSWEVEYGIDVKRERDADWVHLSEGKKPLIFQNRKDALAKSNEAKEKK